MADQVWLNVGCGPWRASAPWLNLDVHDGDGIQPDIVVDNPARPVAAWDTASVDRIYLGHVLEHCPVDQLPDFLADIRRALKPGAAICVVGPDVFRAIERWHQGLEPWDIVVSTLEGPHYFPADGGHQLVDRPDLSWREARHWWNCTEARVVQVLTDAGFNQVTPRRLSHDDLHDWPVTAYSEWQMAVTATN